MRTKVSLLTQNQISLLGQVFETLVFPNDFDLIYENHIPTMGVVILEGKLELLKRSKVLEELGAGMVLGVRELLKGDTLPFACRVQANTKVILLGKYQILQELKNKNNSELISLLNFLN